MTRVTKLTILVVVTVALAIGSLVVASTGVRDQESAYGTQQPDVDDLTLDLEVQAAYDDDDIHWRFTWPTEDPSFFHDYFVYEDGEWERYSGESDGSGLHLNEDRLTFLLDDGSVDGFEEYGGFMTVHSFTREMSPEDYEGEEVEEVFGEGTDDLRKMVPGSMDDPTDWRTRLDDDELAELAEAGYFLDLWHWRSHRSNPIGFSDAQHVLDHRLSDSGDGPYETNWDDDLDQPLFMFDPEVTGQHAMDWDRLQDLGYTQDDWYYLAEDVNVVAYDPDHDWQEGDVLPRRVLTEPTESRGQIFAQGVVDDGEWNLELTRALDTGYPTEDKILEEHGLYAAAFAVHANATANRWHYTGMPISVGLGRGDADLTAERVDGEPDWDEIESVSVELFYPGVIGWDHLTDRAEHAGAGAVQGGAPFSAAHDEESMAFYALESEYRDEIITQWWLTGLVWILFVIAASLAFVRLARGRLEPAGAGDGDPPGGGRGDDGEGDDAKKEA